MLRRSPPRRLLPAAARERCRRRFPPHHRWIPPRRPLATPLHSPRRRRPRCLRSTFLRCLPWRSPPVPQPPPMAPRPFPLHPPNRIPCPSRCHSPRIRAAKQAFPPHRALPRSVDCHSSPLPSSSPSAPLPTRGDRVPEARRRTTVPRSGGGDRADATPAHDATRNTRGGASSCEATASLIPKAIHGENTRARSTARRFPERVLRTEMR